jgi:thioredoxin reductase
MRHFPNSRSTIRGTWTQTDWGGWRDKEELAKGITNWSLDREPFALETRVPGIFCAGDVRRGSVKRVASTVGENSMSFAYLHEYLALTDTHSQVSA